MGPKELRHGWNSWPCGCQFVVNLKWLMVCSFDGPNHSECAEMTVFKDEILRLVTEVPTDWHAVRLVNRKRAEHLSFSEELIERGWPLKNPTRVWP
ncbi:hypothetical protein U5640_16955 [Streptomyces sp. SS7]|uniref:hypothetical protein n=1 Tax=Streptomyces sp. SS7 TaxID=3108485 RepID=UPI0030EF84FB